VIAKAAAVKKLEVEEEAPKDVKLDVAPKKINWDLKRDIQKKVITARYPDSQSPRVRRNALEHKASNPWNGVTSVWFWHPQNLQPSTLNPQPWTLNPQPWTMQLDKLERRTQKAIMEMIKDKVKEVRR